MSSCHFCGQPATTTTSTGVSHPSRTRRHKPACARCEAMFEAERYWSVST